MTLLFAKGSRRADGGDLRLRASRPGRGGGGRLAADGASLDAAYRAGGFAALVPQPEDQPAHLAGTYRDRPGDVPSERTLQRWSAGLPLAAPEPGTSQAAGSFGRFEADAPMDRWPGDRSIPQSVSR